MRVSTAGRTFLFGSRIRIDEGHTIIKNWRIYIWFIILLPTWSSAICFQCSAIYIWCFHLKKICWRWLAGLKFNSYISRPATLNMNDAYIIKDYECKEIDLQLWTNKAHAHYQSWRSTKEYDFLGMVSQQLTCPELCRRRVCLETQLVNRSATLAFIALLAYISIHQSYIVCTKYLR